MAAQGLRPRNSGAVHVALLQGGLVRFACKDAIGPPAWAILIEGSQPVGCFGSWQAGATGTWRADSGAKAQQVETK
jgi:hypothetical protein